MLSGLLAAGCTAPVSAFGPVAATAAPTSPAASTTQATAHSTAPSGVPATAAPLRLTSVLNFRDVAGDGLPLAGGGRMATGVVYRSAQMSSATPADIARLRRAGVRLVIDLRTDAVAARYPDPVIAGARHELVNIFGAHGGAKGGTSSVSAARAAMRRMNADFVDSAYQRARIAEALGLIASAKGPVLIHCQAGKDRTGWMSALLQLIAGADREQVIAEYLKSNAYRARAVEESYARTLSTEGVTAALVQRARQRVEESYLGAGLAELTTRYGTLDGYLTEGLGLSRATIATLRDRLTA